MAMFQNCTNQTKGLSYIIKVRRRRMVNKWEISKDVFGELTLRIRNPNYPSGFKYLSFI